MRGGGTKALYMYTQSQKNRGKSKSEEEVEKINDGGIGKKEEKNYDSFDLNSSLHTSVSFFFFAQAELAYFYDNDT